MCVARIKPSWWTGREKPIIYLCIFDNDLLLCMPERHSVLIFCRKSCGWVTVWEVGELGMVTVTACVTEHLWTCVRLMCEVHNEKSICDLCSPSG